MVLVHLSTGVRELDIVANTNRRIICASCGLLSLDPHLMSCGNVLCPECLTSASTRGNLCPCGTMCGHPFSFKNFELQVLNLMVKCPNFSSGCGALLPMRCVDDHLRLCKISEPLVQYPGHDVDVYRTVDNLADTVSVAIDLGYPMKFETLSPPIRYLDRTSGAPSFLPPAQSEESNGAAIKDSADVDLGARTKEARGGSGRSAPAPSACSKRTSARDSRIESGPYSTVAATARRRNSSEKSPASQSQAAAQKSNSNSPTEPCKSRAHRKMRENDTLYMDEGVLKLLESGVSSRTRRVQKSGLDPDKDGRADVRSGRASPTVRKSNDSILKKYASIHNLKPFRVVIERMPDEIFRKHLSGGVEHVQEIGRDGESSRVMEVGQIGSGNQPAADSRSEHPASDPKDDFRTKKTFSKRFPTPSIPSAEKIEDGKQSGASSLAVGGSRKPVNVGDEPQQQPELVSSKTKKSPPIGSAATERSSTTVRDAVNSDDVSQSWAISFAAPVHPHRINTELRPSLSKEQSISAQSALSGSQCLQSEATADQSGAACANLKKLDLELNPPFVKEESSCDISPELNVFSITQEQRSTGTAAARMAGVQEPGSPGDDIAEAGQGANRPTSSEISSFISDMARTHSVNNPGKTSESKSNGEQSEKVTGVVRKVERVVQSSKFVKTTAVPTALVQGTLSSPEDTCADKRISSARKQRVTAVGGKKMVATKSLIRMKRDDESVRKTLPASFKIPRKSTTPVSASPDPTILQGLATAERPAISLNQRDMSSKKRASLPSQFMQPMERKRGRLEERRRTLLASLHQAPPERRQSSGGAVNDDVLCGCSDDSALLEQESSSGEPSFELDFKPSVLSIPFTIPLEPQVAVKESVPQPILHRSIERPVLDLKTFSPKIWNAQLSSEDSQNSRSREERSSSSPTPSCATQTLCSSSSSALNAEKSQAEARSPQCLEILQPTNTALQGNLHRKGIESTTLLKTDPRRCLDPRSGAAAAFQKSAATCGAGGYGTITHQRGHLSSSWLGDAVLETSSFWSSHS